MIMIYPVHVVAPNVKMKVLACEICHKKILDDTDGEVRVSYRLEAS